ncbi:MAG TPA: MlaD family protein [Chitinispirillaceae bacterium]|nr:MlaD family protein [Chitinispirillaceae bacterium]
MSISQAQRARLGVFVIIGIALIAVFFAVPLGVKFTSKFSAYTAYFQGESLSGLEQGAVVKFSGVPIGKIIKINYLPNDLTRVKVIMEIQEDFPMKTDMVASTGAMGITGLKYVEITGGTNEAPSLKPGSEIKTKISSFTAITGKAESIIAKIELLLNHLNEISNPDSLKSIKTIIDNVAEITGSVNEFVDETRPGVKTIASSADSILKQVSLILSDVNKFTTTMNKSISSDQLSQTFSRIDSTVQSIKILTDNLSMMVRQSREDFTVGMQNIREATENANQLTKILVENPSLLLKGESQRERDIR